MFKSMTAYGRATTASPLGRITIELLSVNRKHLEINTVLPGSLLRFDVDIKKWISAAVNRGQVNVKIFVAYEGQSPISVSPNLPLARQIKSAWNSIAQDLHFYITDADLINVLMQSEGLLVFEEEMIDEETYRKALNNAVQQALVPFLAMKQHEGQALQHDITKRFEKLSLLIQGIAVKAPGATERYRQKLMERLNEVMAGGAEDEERILREVALYAERIDITEELTRFKSHLSQVEKLIHSESDEGIGKKLEFIIQELNRETNTVGSKSSDIDVTHHVVEIKSELEKIREQIQNIE